MYKFPLTWTSELIMEHSQNSNDKNFEVLQISIFYLPLVNNILIVYRGTFVQKADLSCLLN